VIFFTVFGICLVAIAVTLNVIWTVVNWRQGVLMVLGIIFFLLIIAGMVLNTIFLVREIRKNEQHDAFINAVTHELKTPVASIRLYLQTLQTRDLDEAKRREFYQVMLDDSDRLLRTIEQVLRAGSTTSPFRRTARMPVDISEVARECVELARTRFHIGPTLQYDERRRGPRCHRRRQQVKSAVESSF
jgi:signal transduction histidine kinase